ncbi:MAG: NlpC/P60 family protein [Tagaea sp.]|nr:NlpC/P60 family protein [Tagaea sp.]
MSRFGEIPAWVADYQAIPFVESGRTRAGADCYGLVLLVLREQFGVDIPADPVGAWRLNAGRAERVALAARVARARESWQELRRDEAGPGAVLLLRHWGRPLHVGLVLNDRAFLHSEPGAGPHVASYVEGVWSGDRVLGFYAWRAAA